MPCISPLGLLPSGHPLTAQKLYSVVSVPPGVIWKTVPPLLAPPPEVVPYRSPLAAWMSTPYGPPPSVHFAWEQKLYSVVKVPLGVISKTVPEPVAPPRPVTP